MRIDYIAEAEKFRPSHIKTLLVGEAPPSSGKRYFYVPFNMSLSLPIEKDRSLPATVFNHYFNRRPKDKEEYYLFLRRLQEKGVFLIDICDKPIKVRNCPKGLNQIIDEIPKLREKMTSRKIFIPDWEIIFLLARKNYIKKIKLEFPESNLIRWIDFGMSSDKRLF